jgi:ADP-L-glycero-D-manno-heptose 6-epimerase
MTHILVTGYLGFIGRELFKTLSNSGLQVFGLGDEYFKAPDWRLALANELENSNPSLVFHVGACSNTLESDVQLMMTRNYESTKAIADWCASNDRKLVYSSSAANYGEDGIYPSNLYGWSKYTAEDYVINRGGIALRYFNVYGPGEELKGNMASFVHQAYVKNLIKERIFIFPNKPRRDFVYIDDIIEANIYASENYSSLKGDYYEVSTGVASSFEQLLELLELEFSYYAEQDIPKGYQFFTCGNKNKWLPGWQPKYNLGNGIKKYKEYLDSQTYDLKNL